MTTLQIVVSLALGAALAVLWELALIYERWRSKTWRLPTDDGRRETSLFDWEEKR